MGGRGGLEEVSEGKREQFIIFSTIKIFNKRNKLEKEQKRSASRRKTRAEINEI